MFFSVFKTPRCRCSATCWLFTRWGSFRVQSLKLTWNRPKQGTIPLYIPFGIFCRWWFSELPVWWDRICFLVSWEGIGKIRPFQSFRPPKRKRLFRLPTPSIFRFIDSAKVAKVWRDFEFSCRHLVALGGETNKVLRVSNHMARIGSWCFVKYFLRSSSIQLVMLCHVCCCKIIWNKTVLRVYQIFYVFRKCQSTENALISSFFCTKNPWNIIASTARQGTLAKRNEVVTLPEAWKKTCCRGFWWWFFH